MIKKIIIGLVIVISLMAILAKIENKNNNKIEDNKQVENPLQHVLECEISKKETANLDTITYRTKGEFIYKVEQGKLDVNAVESAISYKKSKSKGDLGMVLLLTTYTYQDRPSFVVKRIKIEFTDKTSIELTVNDNIVQPLNDAINVVGNFIDLDKQHYVILSTKNIHAIELNNTTNPYRIVSMQKIIKEQIKCILKEINKT